MPTGTAASAALATRYRGCTKKARDVATGSAATATSTSIAGDRRRRHAPQAAATHSGAGSSCQAGSVPLSGLTSVRASMRTFVATMPA
jgi:hypothetical protein